MAQLEKTTIKTQTAIIIIVSLMTSLTGGLTAYLSTTYGFKDAMKDMRYELNNRLKDIEAVNSTQNIYIESLQTEGKDMKNAIVSYIGTGLKPEETELRKRK